MPSKNGLRIAVMGVLLLSLANASDASSRMSKSMAQHFKQFSDQLQEPEPVIKVTLPAECAGGYVPPTSSFDFWSL